MPRHLDERLLLRFPGVARLLARGVTSLPPGSPIRRRWLKRTVRRGLEAYSRGDPEPVLLLMHPAVDIHLNGVNLLGMPTRYHGHEGARAWMRGWRGEWGDYEEKTELLIDMGDLVILRNRISARGERSGVTENLTVGNCFYFSDGAVTRWEMHLHWSDLAEARGLADVAQSAAARA